VNEIDQMPVEDLRKVVQFQAEQQRRYRKMFLNQTEHTHAELFDEAPELAMVELDGIDATKLLQDYREFESRYDTAPFDPEGHKFRFYPGGVTIWSGFPGTGKTTLLRQLVCHLLQRGRGVFVVSLEEPPQHMLARLCMTAAGTTQPTDDQGQWFIDGPGVRLRLWGKIGLASFKTVLGASRYAIKREGCQHVVIDSLTCLDIGGTDWDGQRGVANSLCDLARASGAHIHLVAHPRKPQKGDGAPDLSEIAGSSDLVRLADNVVFVQRHLDTEPVAFDQPTEMYVVIRKQRHGTGACCRIDGWFHRHERQFDLLKWRERPIRYLPDGAYQGAYA